LTDSGETTFGLFASLFDSAIQGTLKWFCYFFPLGLKLRKYEIGKRKCFGISYLWP
jgi:hypothetical protein